MIFLESDYTWYLVVAIIFIFLLLSPAIVLALFGWRASRKGKKDNAKELYILALVYLVISLGMCGVMIGASK